ncbi:heme-copper oxidase subunit III [bacterium]|nr:heme-copper oxidase subunit III [bacterium]
MTSVPWILDPSDEPTSTGVPHGKLGMWVFLASEVMLFGSLISSYIVLRIGSPLFIMPSHADLSVPVAAANTFVLIVSSVTMVLALAAIQQDNRKAMIGYLTATILCGIFFLCVKGYEYPHKWHLGITISSGLFGSFYYTMTGLHGLHVLGGIFFNSYILYQGVRGRLSARRCERVEYAGIYWHFVDLVWVVLFPLLYLL